MMIITEDSRNQLMAKSKQGRKERDGKTRFQKRPSVLNYGGYAAEKGYKPTDDTPCYLNIRAISTRKGSKVEKFFKIDKVML